MRAPCPGRALALALAVPVALTALLVAECRAATPSFPGLATTTLASADGPIPIPDNGSVISVVSFAGTGTVIDVDVSVDITHPQADNLDIWLVSPSGTTITLTTDNGGANDNVFAGTTFDDQASGTPSAPNVRNFIYTDLVPTGPLQPEEALSALVGEEAAGPWALVVVDDAGGNTGTLRSWSIAVSTVPSARPGSPLVVTGTAPMPITTAAGVTSTAVVAGAGPRLYDVDVTVDVSHTNASDLDLVLIAPSGRQIDLVTDVGGGNDDLYRGTVFDDGGGTPIGDLLLPPDLTPFTTVVPEGALGAFVGEDPNGTWTLTVVDDTASYSGMLNAWSLRLVTATACGDGVLDPGEVCDDGNVVHGDGCDGNCVPTGCGNGAVSPGEDCDDGNTVGGDGCPSTCKNGEVRCDDCVDDDGNGLVDAADPACEPAPLELRSASLSKPRGSAKLGGTLALPAAPEGTVALTLGDANGPPLCATLGPLAARGGKRFSAKGTLGGGPVSVKLSTRRGGSLVVRGRGLDLGGLDAPRFTVGLSIGAARFSGAGDLRSRPGGRWVLP